MSNVVLGAGEIFEMTNMYPEHRFVMSNLEKILDRFTSGLRCVVMREAKYDWQELDEKFEPDISILCGLRHRKRLCYTDVPRFVAEVLSDTTEKRDRTEKMEAYAKVGVQEYWLIDWRVPGGKVERYMLDDNGESFIKHDEIFGDTNDLEKTKINVISFPNWQFTMKELMNHVGEEELVE